MDIEARSTQHGSVYAIGIWLAAVEYNAVAVEPTGVVLKIRVTNGERDLSTSSIFAEEMEMELADGRRCTLRTLSGSSINGVYRVRLETESLSGLITDAVT